MMGYESIKKITDAFSKIEMPTFTPAAFEPLKIEVPDIPVIDPEDTIVGEIKIKIEEQNKLVSQQISILVEQNQLLSNNYSKLKDLYDTQTESYKSAQEDLQRSCKHNAIMMIISVIAMLAAIASPIVTIWVSK